MADMSSPSAGKAAAGGETAAGKGESSSRGTDDKGALGGAKTISSELSGWIGSGDPIVLVGVALYVGLVYTFWDDFRAYFAWAESYAITIQTGLPRISFLDLMGSLLTCQAYRASAHFPKHAAETLVACTLMQFGGTFLVGVVVLGQTPSWMASHTAWPALFVSWWITFFSPLDLWYNRVMSYKLAGFLIGYGRAVSAAHAITSWGADKALTAHYTKATASALCTILSGTIAGCGGGILADLLGLEGASWNLQRTPAALASPSFSVQRSFGASCLYYILADPHGYLHSAPFPLSWLGSWSVAHGSGPCIEAAAMVAVYVTANHFMDYFRPNYEDPICKILKLGLGLVGVTASVNPQPALAAASDDSKPKTS